MKQGSADDPFADDDSETESPTEPTTSQEQTETATDSTTAQSVAESTTATESSGSASPETGHSLPWLYRRENARDGRDKTKQLHLQQSTAQQESAFKSAVESEVGQAVQLTDLREAAILVAMDHVDEVGDQLREWGYDFD